MQKRPDRLTEYRIDEFERVDDGIHLSIGDSFRQIRVGLWLRLIDGEFPVSMHPMELYEDDAALYRLFAVDLLPGIMRTEHGGALLHADNDRLLLLSGAKTQTPGSLSDLWGARALGVSAEPAVLRGRNPEGGLMALATQGASDTECRVATDGAGGRRDRAGIFLPAHLDRSGRFRETGDPFYPHRQGAAGRSVLRQTHSPSCDGGSRQTHLNPAGGGIPEVAYLLNAYIMKMFYAIECEGMMMHGQEQRQFSFKNRDDLRGSARLLAAGA